MATKITMKNNSKEYFRCTTCSYETPQWLGRCPSCGEWNTFIRQERNGKGKTNLKNKKENRAQLINDFVIDKENQRYQSGIRELDRVLGGGLVSGSLILVGGEPGIGKSTLVLQAADQLSKNIGCTLYVTAEESIRQI
ncbi:MAG: ATPase domain-containing protein, partial [Atribacterota bacterium]|nr:ATPase domain-containing protein [Atribacterota bacterium]